MSPQLLLLDGLGDSFYNNVIREDRWKIILLGLRNTVVIALVAVIIGIAIGTVVALVKVHHAQTGKLWFAARICDLYLALIRGTPVVIQLMIFFFILFKTASFDLSVPIAALSFGINSGAYVSEIIRAGIMSIDRGQFEAGRSLGLNQTSTMRLIILPQAVKNVLPALFNEFITLLKETSVAGYVAVQDLTRSADIIRSRTFEPFFPLMIAAAIYLVLVLGLTGVQKRMERRLSQGDRR